MELRNKNILIISPEEWGVSMLSKHHYAVELARRDNHVFFLEPKERAIDSPTTPGNIYLIYYNFRYRGVGRLPNFLSGLLTKWEFAQLEKKLNVQFHIVWNFENSRFFNLKYIRKPILKISHIVDFNQDFQFVLATKTADICLGVAKSIVVRQLYHTPFAFKIQHGLFYDTILHTDKINQPNHPISVNYIGNLLIKYLHWELIEKVINKYPNVHFYFHGPLGKSNISNETKIPLEVRRLKKHSNVFFEGAVPPEELRKKIHAFDIHWLAYKVDKYPKQLENSHKILEYLHTGKTTLITFTQEYENKQHLVEMAKNQEDFINKFDEIIHNIEVFNSADRQKERIKYALTNTYTKQVDRIEQLINDYVYS